MEGFLKLKNSGDKMKYKCPCCNRNTMDNSDPLFHDICPVCYWKNDPIQNEDENYCGGANKVSLAQARINYLEFGASSEEFVSKVRNPFENEI